MRRAWRCAWCSTATTLHTEDDIEATVKAVLDALQQRVAARLRA